MALLGLLATLGAHAAHAQRLEMPTVAGEFALVDTMPRPSVFGRLQPEAPATLAPPKFVSGEPRSFQVVAVAIPAGFPLNRPIQYSVIQSGSSLILGRTSGTIPAGAPIERTVLVTLQVPTSPRAGTLPLARVRFAVEGGASIEVPIELSVARAGRIELTSLEGLRAVHPGETFTLSYRVTNLGNAADTVEIQAIAPAGWHAHQPAPTIALGVNGVVDRLLTVSIPFESNTGGASIRLIAVSRGRPVASVEIPVQVLGNGVAAGPGGPIMTTGVGFSAGASGGVVSAFTMGLDGQLTDGIRVTARGTLMPNQQASGSYGLAQAGFYSLPPSLELSSSTWRIGVGATSARLTDLTGFSVAGDGASAGLTAGRWNVSSFLARPLIGSTGVGGVNGSDGILAGGRLDVDVGAGKLTGAASHLSEDGLDPRHLDAISLGASVPTFFNGTLSSELAERSFDGGSGLGWSANYARRDATNQVSLHVSHAPGGVAAFAQATSQVQASVGQTLGRVILNGSYYRNGDDSRAGLSSLVSMGWTLGAQMHVSDLVGLGLDTHRSDFNASGISGSYGTGETSVGGSLNLRNGGQYATVGGSVAQVGRLTTTTTGVSLNDAALRTSTHAELGTTGRFGVYEIAAQMDRSGAGVGFLPRQLGFSVRANRVPLISSGATRVFATGSVQRLFWFGDRPSTTALRAGLSMELNSRLAVSLNAERNPFLLSADGSAGWLYSLAVDRRTLLPRLARTTTQGVVFQDLNGNGRRDPGEPGLSSALVRRGQESGATSKVGEFQFAGDVSDSIVIDPMSLPVGWIVGKTTRDGKRWNLAVIAVSAVEVELALTPDAAVRVDSTALDRVVVMAQDDRGRTWVARSKQRGVAIFDALPTGHYTVKLDVADIEEPLTPTVDPIEFVVSTNSMSPHLSITLRPRPVKVKDMSTSRNGSATVVGAASQSPRVRQ